MICSTTKLHRKFQTNTGHNIHAGDNSSIECLT